MITKPLASLSDFELRKHLLEVERALRETTPLFDEYLLTTRMLEAKQPGSEPLLSGVRTIIEAIELSLGAYGRAMTKQDIFEFMVLNGYELKPNSGRALVGNTVNYHVRNGRLQRYDEMVGLKVWGPPNLSTKFDKLIDK